MSTNRNLTEAKRAKNDEFYTSLSDIQAEMNHYTDKFYGKVVFCNCDDPFESNFVKYFLMNFNRLGLKELIATGYKTSPIGGTEIGEPHAPYALRVTETKKYLIGTQSDLDIRGAKYFLETEGSCIMTPLTGNAALDENGNQIQVPVKIGLVDENGVPVLGKNGKQKTKTEKRDLYYEAGDFRSDMSLSLLREADVVVTNPPFSLARDFLTLLVQYNKEFLIIGSKNAITYKEVFPLIRENKMWLGIPFTSGNAYFKIPDGIGASSDSYAQGVYDEKTRLVKFRNCCWFTNIDHVRRHTMLPLDLGFTYYGHEDMYPKYDNYDAINVNKVAEIPCDYEGVMGVPITFLDHYCPEQFEIVAFRKGNDGKDLVFTREREREFNHTFESLYDQYRGDNQECRGKDQWEAYLRTYHDKKEKGEYVEPVDLVYPIATNLQNGLVNDCTISGKKTYVRALIRRKEKTNGNENH